MSGLLLLGGSTQQVVAIQSAKRLGIRTVLCDYLPNNPGRKVADSFHLVSTTDVQGILKVAQEENVDGILAYASDPAALTAALVAEQLGLAGNPSASVRCVSEKQLFRSHLLENGFACPRFVAIEPDVPIEAAIDKARQIRLPSVVKPTDSSGSKGVSIVQDPSSLGSAICYARSFSRNGLVIIEEYIERGYPCVIGGDLFVVDGQVRFWGLMDALRGNARDGLVPIGEMFPTALSGDRLELLKSELSRLVRTLGLLTGEFNVEAIISSNGEPYILELGARAGGNLIPLQLSDVSGVDLVKANVLCAMGQKPEDIDFDGVGPAVATYVLHSDSPGTFEGTKYSPSIAQALYRECLYADVGNEIGAFENAGHAIGISFLRFKDSTCMRKALSDPQNVAEIQTSERRGDA